MFENVKANKNATKKKSEDLFSVYSFLNFSTYVT